MPAPHNSDDLVHDDGTYLLERGVLLQLLLRLMTRVKLRLLLPLLLLLLLKLGVSDG